MINTTTICVLFYCTCLFQLSLRVPTSSFSDKARAAVLDRWLRFHIKVNIGKAKAKPRTDAKEN